MEDGTVGRNISLPLGVLRVERGKSGEQKAREMIRRGLKDAGLAKAGRDKPFYMVGGSWRALAKLDMIATDFPIPATHHYRMKPQKVVDLRRMAERSDLASALSGARQASAPVAAMLLEQVVEEIRPSELLSASGLREGLLYSQLESESGRSTRSSKRRATRAEASIASDNMAMSCTPDGAPLFDGPLEQERLRLASCLLADVAWQAAPMFRADRGVEMALHGDWTAVDAAGRVMMAQALTSNFGATGCPTTA